MKHVISVSRRTDVPAFYGEWFMRRVRAGEAGYVNPFGGRPCAVSLRPGHVLCFVFWSKNFEPFEPCLEALDRAGFSFYLHFTITGHPRELEGGVPDWQRAAAAARRLAARFSPDRVLWRFDPIVFSSITPPESVMEMFAALARALDGSTRRCYFSFAQSYAKVLNNFKQMHEKHGITFRVDDDAKETCNAFTPDVTADEKLAFARALAAEAAGRGIGMYSCCGPEPDEPGAPAIHRAHCVDPELIARITGADTSLAHRPTRERCGCHASFDIGAYDTCPHGCVYCYANANKQLAYKNYKSAAARTDTFALNCARPREDFPDIDEMPKPQLAFDT